MPDLYDIKTGEVLASGAASLPELAAAIEHEHQDVLASALRSIESAVSCGTLLLQAQVRTEIDGELWIPWVNAHLSFSHRTAQAYMRLALNKEFLLNAQHAAPLTLRSALKLLSDTSAIKAEREAELERQREAIAAGEFVAGVGPYDVIVLDPPWPYGTKYDPEGRRAANPYPEMSLDSIGADGDAEIVRKAADDCILWLWTTHKFMRHSFELLDRWGFEDKAIMTWVKDRMGLGQWLRSQSEFCIMAVSGSPLIQLTNQTTVLHGSMREHSRKPDEFYDMIGDLCVGIRRYDRFAREPREGWDIGGNDTSRFEETAA